MILRLRSRDGLERVEVEDDATVMRLKQVGGWRRCGWRWQVEQVGRAAVVREGGAAEAIDQEQGGLSSMR